MSECLVLFEKTTRNGQNYFDIPIVLELVKGFHFSRSANTHDRLPVHQTEDAGICFLIRILQESRDSIYSRGYSLICQRIEKCRNIPLCECLLLSWCYKGLKSFFVFKKWTVKLSVLCSCCALQCSKYKGDELSSHCVWDFCVSAFLCASTVLGNKWPSPSL